MRLRQEKTHHHTAILGELDGVIHQIIKHLRERIGQPLELVGLERALHHKLERVARRVGKRLEFVHDILRDAIGAQIARRFVLLTEAGHFQHIVDLGQRPVTARLGGFQQVEVDRIEVAVLHQLERGHDAVQRRAHLVAHGGQERALGA